MDTMVYTAMTQAESLRSARIAHVAVKATKLDIPRKGDVWGIADESGEFIETGIVATKPGGTLVSVIYDRNRQKGMLGINRFKRIGTAEWSVSC